VAFVNKPPLNRTTPNTRDVVLVSRRVFGVSRSRLDLGAEGLVYKRHFVGVLWVFLLFVKLRKVSNNV
jgi:hypothetical protein